MLSKFYSGLILLVLFTVLASCSSTSLETRWHDPDYTGAALQKILVIGVMKDNVTRRAFEDGFSGNIKSAGLTGVASYTLMPDIGSIDEQEEVAAIVREAGADAVLIATLKGINKEERVVPPSVDYVPTIGFGYGMYSYYGMSHQAVYRPGYTTIDTIIQLETRVFASSNEKLVWAGNTRSFNPSSTQKVISELASVVVSDMQKSGLLK